MKRSVLFIYNPHAGPHKWRLALHRLSSWWEQRGWDVHLEPTQAPGHATTLAAEAARRGTSLVIAIGGDGTLNETAAGLLGSETILGLIPAGTGNSFARELGLPINLGGFHLLSASNALLNGRVHSADVGRSSTGRVWLLWSGIGLDAHMIIHVEPRSKIFKRLGRLGFLFKALWHMFSYQPRPLTVTVDGRSYKSDFLQVLVCNCRFWGGGNIPLNPDGVMDDGRFEVWCFEGRRPVHALYYTLNSLRAGHRQLPGVIMFSGSSVRIEAPIPTPVHLDAEPLSQTPYETELIPRALNLLVPPSAKPGLFLAAGTPLDQFIVDKRPTNQ